MPALRTCVECGGEIPAGVLVSICASCLLRLAAQPDALRGSASARLVPGRDAWLVDEFEDYELLAQIGRGGMGVVYKARQRSLNRLVALKMVLLDAMDSATLITRFRLEAEAAAKLDHPNIVTPYEVGECHGKPFFSMRLVEGGNLAQRMAEYRLPTEASDPSRSARRSQQSKLATLLLVIARAVHYAHERGIVHRDIKPSNILITPEGMPHLTDFGVAKILEADNQLTGTTQVIGTPSYMAPEQASGGKITRAADIFSLGAILYELLTGRPPFRADTALETLRRLTREEATHPLRVNPSIDRDLGTICLKCIEKNPLQRYATADDLAEDLQRWLRREPIRARPATVPSRMHRWVSRNPVVSLLMAGLLIALVAALFMLTASIEKEREKALAVRVLREGFYAEIDEMWKRDRSSLTVSSERMAMLSGKFPPAIGGQELRLRFGVYTHNNPKDIPTVMVTNYSPFLTHLETTMSRSLGRPVRIDFNFFPTYDAGVAALTKGEVDFMRIGAAPYFEAKKSDPGLRILVAQRHDHFNGVIFTQATNQSIKTLQDLRGKTFAFGNKISTTGSILAKTTLLEAGLHADDLRSFKYLPSHDAATADVASGTNAQAGAAKETAFLKAEGLRRLATYPNVSIPWVAASKLDPRVGKAIQDGLVAVDSGNPMLKLLEDDVTGFWVALDEDFAPIVKAINKSKEFGSP